MNFVAQVEDHLRDLGAEARKTHPGVKEASERAILHLRSLQTQYVAAVRRAGASKSPTTNHAPSASSPPPHAHPTTALFRSQDVLRPFLLALRHPDASPCLVGIAMESIQLLLRGDAVRSEDGGPIGRVLVVQARECRASLGGTTGSVGMGMIQVASTTVSGALGFASWGKGATSSSSSSMMESRSVLALNQRAAKEDQSIAFKVLQTITMLVDSRSIELSGEVLGQCLLGCLILGAGESYSEGGDKHSASGLKMDAKDGGHVGASLSGVANVRRTALATMNQILSILFERARDVMMAQPLESIEESSFHESEIMMVALQTLKDLCVIVQNFQHEESSSGRIQGPFSVAVAEGLAPSPNTCFSLIDVIFKQRGNDFFRFCREYFRSHDCNTEGGGVHGEHALKSVANPHLQFAVQSIHLTSQLVLTILQSQSKHYATTSTIEKSPESSFESISFCSFYYATSLGSTILTSYLGPLSLEFYEKFDTIKYDAIDHDSKSEEMSKIALNMIQLLVGFVSGATDAYHKSEFEDGYIFSQTEREYLNIGLSDSASAASMDDSATSRRRSTVQTGVLQPTPDPLISNDRLWRAFLSLEVIYSLLCSHLEQLVLLNDIVSRKIICADATGHESSSLTHSTGKSDMPTINTIAKATSDLATISGSNRERILHVVLIAHDDKSPIGEPSSAATSLAEKFLDSLSGGSGEVPVCDTGLATWMAFKSVLALVQSLKRIVQSSKEAEFPNSQRNIARRILGEAFAPSVSLLQHFIKRVSGSHVVVSQTLCAYEDLAYASMMLDSIEENLRRQTILTSLCKLCLPSWGKNRANSQLKEANIDSLWVLLWIVHFQYDDVHDEWHTILSTLDQLGILSIKSSKLPESYSKKASDIAEALVRLPKFTTCFSDKALLHFVSSLVSLSEVVSFALFVEQSSDLSRQNSESFDYGDGKDEGTSGGRESIGGKLMSFAGRSLGFVGGSSQTMSTTNSAIRRSHSVDSASPQFCKVYSDDFREASCTRMMTMKISTPRSIIRQLPLPLLLLCVVAEANSYRFAFIEEALALHLCDIVAKSTAPEYRTFAMEILIHFIPLSLSDSPENSAIRRSQPISTPTRRQKHKPLDITPINSDQATIKYAAAVRSKVHLLNILCNTMRSSSQPETAETGLNALHIVLEGACHDLSGDNLVSVVETLSVLSGFSFSENGCSDVIDRANKSWVNMSAKSFQIFKLIFDNFMEPTDVESPSHSVKERESIVDCCVAFGKSRHDVNTSLTATGMLWTLADQDPTPGTLDLVLSKLSYLALDNRPELRNCAVNTLVSCAVGRGHQFTDEQWERVLNETIFGIMKDISGAIQGSDNEHSKTEDNRSSQRYKVAVHHSRDSATKQWSTTLVLTLRGLERVLRLFFSQLLASTSFKNNGHSDSPWFLYTWKEILKMSLESATLCGGRETLEIRLAGIELITLCAQLSCVSGMVASANSARVGTNMEVVGGALRSVRSATVPENHKAAVGDTPLEPDVEKWRTHLFDLAFSSLVADFRHHLEASDETPHSSEHYMIDSVLNQVLNKLTGELAKLYECCKNDEMLPESCELRLDIFAGDHDSYESRFVELLLILVEKTPRENSRFLNQVQRGVMTLLQSMASHSSMKALKALTSLSGDYMFVRSKSLSEDADHDGSNENHGEVFELEAAKTIANVFDSDGMADEVKVVVMCSVLSQHIKLYGNPELCGENTSTRKASEARYDLFISVLDSGIEAVARFDDNHKNESVLDAIWDRVLSAVTSILLPPTINRHDAYVYHSKSFLHVVAIVLLHIPTRKYAQAESMLEKGAHRAVEVAFECNAETTALASRIIDGAVDVFLACFMGLCQKMPSSSAVQKLTSKILGELEAAHMGDSSPLEAKAQQNLALAVCESLQATNCQELLIGLFPMLCRLTNVQNDSLRRAAGAILGGVNISEAILRERRRADEAEIKAKEVEEENNALLEEIEYLQAENEELHRQLAVFSESSDYT
eukprot:CCRYP_008917-RA/>CCRYP_008917-RA protein AED:0.02 eAED:0.02 QI:265/1/1/1/1/1/5/228/1989